MCVHVLNVWRKSCRTRETNKQKTYTDWLHAIGGNECLKYESLIDSLPFVYLFVKLWLSVLGKTGDVPKLNVMRGTAPASSKQGSAQSNTQTNKQTNKQTVRQTDRQTDRQTQTDWKTDRQETCRQAIKQASQQGSKQNKQRSKHIHKLKPTQHQNK